MQFPVVKEELWHSLVLYKCYKKLPKEETIYKKDAE